MLSCLSTSSSPVSLLLAREQSHSCSFVIVAFTAPANHILDRYFESEILKTTLATDAVRRTRNGSPFCDSVLSCLLRTGYWSNVQPEARGISLRPATPCNFQCCVDILLII